MTKKKPAKERPALEGSTLTEQLRQAIRQSGESLNHLAGRTGVDRARLSRFVRGERGLSLAAVDDLCRALDLRLVWGEAASERPARGRKKGKPA